MILLISFGEGWRGRHIVLITTGPVGGWRGGWVGVVKKQVSRTFIFVLGI